MYYIQTERPGSEGKNVVLIRSIIKTSRKNIGQETEYIEENPSLSYFFFNVNRNPYFDSGEEELEIEGPFTISFDNVNSTTINEFNKNSLMKEGLSKEEFLAITDGNLYDNNPDPETGETMEEETHGSPTSSTKNYVHSGEHSVCEQSEPEESLPPEEQREIINDPEEIEEMLD